MAEYSGRPDDFIADQLSDGTGRYTVDGYHGGVAQYDSVSPRLEEWLRWSPEILRDIVSFWNLDEASGTRYDEMGAVDLSDIATVGQRAGKVEEAASFIATNNEVLRASGDSVLSFGDVDFTFAGWFLVDDLNTTKGLLGKWNAYTSNTKEYLLFFNGASNDFWFAVSDNSSNQTVVSPTTAVAGVWYFIVVWHDSVNDKIWIQVDDETPTSSNWSNGVYDNDNNFELGFFVDASNNQRYHDGGIDAVGAWRRVLTADEREFLRNQGLGRQWPFRGVDQGVWEEVEPKAPAPHNVFATGGRLSTGPETDWYEHVWVLPQRIDAGLVLNVAKLYDITVYNSYRYASRSLDDFVNNAGDGVVINNLPTLPDTIEAQAGYDLELEVQPLGPPFINGTLDFEFDVRDVSIVLTGQRTIVFPHEPESPLVEVLHFLTDVRSGRKGTEQRAALRHVPRSQWEMRFLVEGDERRQLESNVFDSQAQLFGVPAWHEAAILAQAAASGAYTVTVDSTAYSSFRDDALAMLYLDYDNSLTLQIESMTSTTITFKTQLTSAFPAGARVLPVRLGLIKNKSARGRKWPVNLQEIRLTFHTWDNDQEIASTSAWNTFNGKVLLDDPNMIRGQLEESSERKIVVVDSVTGTFDTYSEWDVSRRAHLKTFFTRTRQQAWEVRQLMYALRGRHTSFYIPTFYPDLALASDVSSGDNVVTVENVGYTKYVDSRQPRNVVRLTNLTTGASVIRTVTDATELDADTERLTVDSTWGAAFTVDNTQIDFVEKVRLDSDQIKITYVDAVGETYVEAPVVAVLD